jgi:hypothetical protein
MIANDHTELSRRAFLSATGALVVALAAPAELAAAAESRPFGRSVVRPDTLSSYISIDPDGSVVAYYGKIDGGQGLETSIAQLVAEEIDVPWERVRVVMGDTARTVDMGGATAGNGLRQGGAIMRQTAAEARRLLIEMAAKVLDRPAADLTVTDGVVHSLADPGKRASYAELIGGGALDAPIAWSGLAQQLTVKVKAPLKKPSEFKVIGKPMPRRDIAGKVFGTLQQCSDVRLPNMLHARMIRPPVAGAVPVTVDEKSIGEIPGARMVWIKDFLAVVAEKEWNTVKAAQALKVTWSQSKPNFPGHDKLFDHIRQAPVVKRSSDPGIGGFAAQRDRARSRTASSRRCASSRANTSSRPSHMPAWDPPARSPMCATVARRYGPARRSRMIARPALPSFWSCRPRRCGRSGCSAPAAMRATGKATRPPTQRCFPSISAARCGYSIRATRRWPGTRREPRPSTAAVSGSMHQATWSPTRTSARRSRWRTAIRASSIRATRSPAWRSARR